jgi:capsular exopolysaccharide synthesis family protein
MTSLTDQPLIQDARRYLAVLHKRRGLLLTAIGLSLLVAVLHNYTTRPVYQATVQLLIDKGQPKVLPGSQMVDPGLQDMQTEYELLRGRAIAEELVKRLELHKSAELQTGPMMGPWERFQRKFLGRAPEVAVDADGMPLSPAAAAVRSRVSVEPLPGGRLVNLRFRAYDPAIAANAANALAELYIEQRRELRLETSTEATVWLADRVREQRKKLEDAERALLNYQQRHGIAAGPDDAPQSDEDTAALTTAALNARMERLAKETTLAQMRGVGPAQLAAFPQISSSAGVQAARTRIAALQSEQARLSETLGDRHPEMVAVRGEIRQAEDKLHAEVRAALRAFESEVQSARTREAVLQGNLDRAKDSAMAVSRNSVELSALKRDVDSHRQLYQTLIDRNKETGLESELKATNVRIVERAEKPGAPFSPNRTRAYQLALLIGLALGIGLTLLFENFDNTVRTPEDVKAMGMPFLGMIPAVVPPAGATAVRPAALRQPDGPVAEAYRVVRTNLLFSTVAEGGRALVVTSTNPGEGKTTTAANLALSLAANGARVLVVDADLRRPTLHQHFGISKTPGLSDVIIGKRQISEAILTPRGKGFHVLPCGYVPPNPAELLGSQVMREIVGALRTRYDWVLIDTPPVLAMADTPVLCPYVDGVILVIASEASSRPAVQRAVDQLAGVGGSVIGAVLNKVDLKRNSYYYSQYYGEYYRSYYAEPDSRPVVAAGPRPIRRR